jgi:hypothetical protein
VLSRKKPGFFLAASFAHRFMSPWLLSTSYLALFTFYFGFAGCYFPLFTQHFPLFTWVMCRNIKTLFNFDPPVSAEEIRAASLQFVRKISGFNKPSKANEGSFLVAVDEIAGIATRLLGALETNAPPKNREEEAAKAKARAAERFGA